MPNQPVHQLRKQLTTSAAKPEGAERPQVVLIQSSNTKAPNRAQLSTGAAAEGHCFKPSPRYQ